MSKSPSPPTRIVNKKAKFNYEIIETTEAGIVLTGSEVKSLRNGRASLDEAYASVQENQVWLRQCDISPYAQAGKLGHEPKRERKLLLHRREIRKWLGKVAQRGFTLVPLEIFCNERGLMKCRLALVRGKNAADKREAIKERDTRRELERNAGRRR